MTTRVHAVVRIVEIISCGECPHLDDRWERSPWNCTEGGLEIRNKDKIHRHCPLDTKREYLDANIPICVNEANASDHRAGQDKREDSA
jgi:hypothetical protein